MVIKLGGHEVAYAYGYLANAYGLSTNEPITRHLDRDQKTTISDALDEIEKACHPHRIDLPVTLLQLYRTREIISQAHTYEDIQNTIHELRMRMHDELKSKMFLLVPSREASYYGRVDAFGEFASKKFSKVSGDIEKAGDGIALGMYTAAVFHLMRVVEHGVQLLGKKLGVKLAGEKMWQNILDEVNKAVRALPSKTAKDRDRAQTLSGAAAYLYSVKLAWRNPVMHPKASYDEEQAVEIYGHVKAFACHLSAIL